MNQVTPATEHGPQTKLRSFRVEDVEEINRLFFDQYGVYYPYPLKPVMPGDDAIFTVAEYDGEIVGFARAKLVPGYRNIFEFGGLIVRRDMRRHGVAKKLTDHRVAAVVRRNAFMTFSEPLAWGPLGSQFNLLGSRFYSYGIHPFKYPGLNPEFHGDQPASVVFVARHMRATNSPLLRRFLPPEYEQLLHTYLPAELLEPTEKDPPTSPMPDSIHEASHVVSGVAGSEFLDIPANWRETPDRVRAAQREGYRFSAFLPHFGETHNGSTGPGKKFDFVRLYRPHTVDRDFRKVLVLDHLRPLHDFMCREASAS